MSEPDLQTTVEGFFGKGVVMLVYQEPQTCVLCGESRKLHVKQEGARVCFVCFEELGFDLAAKVQESNR